MTVPMWLEERGGRFVASVLGSPQLRADADTKDAAVAALVADLCGRQDQGELVFVDVPGSLARPAPLPPPTPEEVEAWNAVVEEAYRYRDELKAQEFPE